MNLVFLTVHDYDQEKAMLIFEPQKTLYITIHSFIYLFIFNNPWPSTEQIRYGNETNKCT